MSSPGGATLDGGARTVAVVDDGSAAARVVLEALRTPMARRRGVAAARAVRPPATGEPGTDRLGPPEAGGTSVLRGTDALVWIALDTRGAPAVTSGVGNDVRADPTAVARAVVGAAADAGVSHLVVVTSAMVYGVAPGVDEPHPIDGPRRSSRESGQAADLQAVEDVLDEARRDRPGLLVTSVRPATLVGPGVDSIAARCLAAPRLLAARGCRPGWQFCHVADLGRAVLVVVIGRLGPVVTAAAPGAVPSSQVQRLCGKGLLEIPRWLVPVVAGQLHRRGLLPRGPGDLPFAVYPWTVAVPPGWQPAYDNTAALQVLLEEVAADDGGAVTVDHAGALAGALATVAVAVAAATWRRSRRVPP